MTELECWLKFREMMIELDEGKMTKNDIFSLIMRHLDQLKKQDAISDTNIYGCSGAIGFPRSDV